MGYEYENDVVAELTSLGMEYNSNAHYEMADEVEEVYAKAKAFNEVIKKVETEFVSEDLADSIRILVNDYEYDMEEK
ncbi:hypothetical protein JJQ58_00955 [Mammaliicoccus fleurettii]|uniref:Uncharacterized protein n=1 Tax=Mammaliicoccus fleurettii TaxID=150056 RepID=A0ABS5MK93_9STAP|nr:hypothetical protein [Mammaliicoccus fleurettii]MBL0846547.1 hypothetical protein [Mammaliicoccus fleurettii]MBS3670988.1 hypothetical protein [Mammaliicoccus fleurettii]MBS3696047.1 hypothetical protein [Mammaliicoccus fleurettii]